MKEEIKNYISEVSLVDVKTINNDTLIFEAGLLDSMGLLLLIDFLNEKFGIQVNDDELNPKNFESIDSIASFVAKKEKVNT